MPDPSALRVALLSYRGNPYSGGQGVYVRQLSAALTRLGHRVTVFSGQPYPHLEDGVTFVAGAEPRPVPRRRPLPHAAACASSATGSTCSSTPTLCTAAFPEPLTFSLRIRRILAARAR